MFANGLREALAADRCDFLVHSLKDLPTVQPDGLVIAATPPREDARDVVVTRDGTPLGALAPGSRVGTARPAASRRRCGTTRGSTSATSAATSTRASRACATESWMP